MARIARDVEKPLAIMIGVENLAWPPAWVKEMILQEQNAAVCRILNPLQPVFRSCIGPDIILAIKTNLENQWDLVMTHVRAALRQDILLKDIFLPGYISAGAYKDYMHGPEQGIRMMSRLNETMLSLPQGLVAYQSLIAHAVCANGRDPSPAIPSVAHISPLYACGPDESAIAQCLADGPSKKDLRRTSKDLAPEGVAN
ncbi:unnamed protein product [Zymoseptoria tritici ST99CH_3D1]|nr:unnamed protein product [Zymoseptoria tritici ST99CH_3D1]